MDSVLRGVCPVSFNAIIARGFVRSLGITLVLGTICFFAVAAAAEAAPPDNDNFADAKVLTGLPTATTGTNVDATRESGEPQHGGYTDGRSVWYSWTAPGSGTVVVDLSGSSYDTYLSVYTGSNLGSLSLVEEDDDSGTDTTSKLTFSATSGETYRIAVDGYDGDSGLIELGISEFEIPGSISGTVTNSSGSALGDVCVDAYDSSGEYVGDTYTDASGNYTVGGLPAGNYRVRFYDCFGSNNVIGEYYNNKPSLATANQIAVTAGSVTPNINAQLATGGSISGTVTNSSGSALEDVCVDAYDSSGEYVGDADTNASGDYTVGGLPTGNYRVEFYDCGSNNVAGEYYNDKPSLDAANQVAVTAGSNTPNINAQLAPAGSISGTVTNSSGSALEEVCVDVYDSSGEDVGFDITNASGNYTVRGLPTGNYRVRFYDCGSENVASEYYNDKPSLATANQVAVTAGSNTPNINAQLATGGSISGTVTNSSGSALEDVCVNVYDSSGEYVGGADTSTSGAYMVDGLSTGNYRLEFSDCLDSGDFAGEYYDNKPSLAAANQVAVTAGSNTPNINAQLGSTDTTPPDTVINSGPTGTITSSEAIFTFSGDPASDTAKIMCKIDGAAFADCTSPKTFSGLASGPHTVSFRAEDASGNQDQTPATRTFTVDTMVPDTTPPDTVINSGPTGTITSSEAIFTFSGDPASDTAKIMCKIDGAAFADCTSPKTFSGLANGPHTVSFRAEDASGNQDQTPATRTFTVDTTVPPPLEARISKVKVSGPGKAKKGKRVTYKVKVTNSGEAGAQGVKLKVSGKGIKASAKVGTVPAGKTKTVKVKVKPKKPGKIKVAFKVTSTNAGAKTAKKTITVRK